MRGSGGSWRRLRPYGPRMASLDSVALDEALTDILENRRVRKLDSNLVFLRARDATDASSCRMTLDGYAHSTLPMAYRIRGEMPETALTEQECHHGHILTMVREWPNQPSSNIADPLFHPALSIHDSMSSQTGLRACVHSRR